MSGDTAFLVDCLPVIRRRLTRTRFVIDHARYFSDALKPWIARRDGLDRFVLRRDLRDLSRIVVLDPDGGAYLEMPYRSLAHPPVTLWKQQATVGRLQEQSRAQVDETSLFSDGRADAHYDRRRGDHLPRPTRCATACRSAVESRYVCAAEETEAD